MLFIFILMVGGGAIMLLISMVLEQAIFSAVFDDPVLGKGLSVLVAWLLASVGYGYVMTYGPFNPWGFAIYALPGLIIAVWSVREGYRLRTIQDPVERPPDYEAARPFE